MVLYLHSHLGHIRLFQTVREKLDLSKESKTHVTFANTKQSRSEGFLENLFEAQLGSEHDKEHAHFGLQSCRLRVLSPVSHKPAIMCSIRVTKQLLNVAAVTLIMLALLTLKWYFQSS